MKSLYTDPLQHTANGLLNLSAFFQDLARNPATPAGLTDAYLRAAEGMRASAEMTSRTMNWTILAGDGPVSTAMRQFKQFGFIDPSNRNLDNLAVITQPLSKDEIAAAMPDMKARKIISQLFEHRYPVNQFDDEGNHGIPVFVYGPGNPHYIMINLTLVKGELLTEQWCYLKEIILEYTTLEQFWTVKKVFPRGSSLYRDFDEAQTEVHHHVEGVSLHGVKTETISRLDALLALVLPERIGRKMGFEVKDYRMRQVTSHDLSNALPVRNSFHDYRSSDIDAIMEAIFKELIAPTLASRMGTRESFVTSTGIEYWVEPGLYRAYTWEEFKTKRNESSWNRDEPIVKLNGIKIAGLTYSSTSVLPEHYCDDVLNDWEARVKQVCDSVAALTASGDPSADPVEPI